MWYLMIINILLLIIALNYCIALFLCSVLINIIYCSVPNVLYIFKSSNSK